MMKCIKQRTYYLLSTRQNLRSYASLEMTYVRDMPLALSFCTGSDHPELPRMIRPNSDFQHWASPDDPALHRMIWTQTGLTGLEDQSDPEQCSGVVVMRKMPSKVYIEVSSHHWHKFGYIQSDSKQLKHNFNYLILFVCLTKFVSKLAMFLIEPSALQSRYSKS